ncbi:MAG: TonB-dependent receptor plug domain-containing protein [Nitrospirae bacterium]|nr:TonB-dependent receptor plug domain-containing protein [Nitrospirota bacterium]
MRKLIKFLLVIVLLIVSVTAQAAGASADLTQLDLEQLLELEVVTVYGASKFEQKVTEAPASISIVSDDEIKKYGYRTIADILKSVKGFYITTDRNYTFIGVRGFGRPSDYNTRILLLVDGHRLNDNIFDV